MAYVEEVPSSTGHVIAIEIVGTTLDEVWDRRDAYLESYCPLGYGTTFGPARRRDEDGQIVLSGHRYVSCD